MGKVKNAAIVVGGLWIAGTFIDEKPEKSKPSVEPEKVVVVNRISAETKKEIQSSSIAASPSYQKVTTNWDSLGKPEITSNLRVEKRRKDPVVQKLASLDSSFSSNSEFLTEEKSAPLPAKPELQKFRTKTAWISSNGLNVRGGPGTKYSVKFVAAFGNKVKVLDSEGSWLKVSTPSGTTGWLSGKYVSYSKPKRTVVTQKPVKRRKTRTVSKAKKSTSGKYSCARKRCTQMVSCSEARYKLNICGHRQLDRDRDGTPCDSIC